MKNLMVCSLIFWNLILSLSHCNLFSDLSCNEFIIESMNLIFCSQLDTLEKEYLLYYITHDNPASCSLRQIALFVVWPDKLLASVRWIYFVCLNSVFLIIAFFAGATFSVCRGPFLVLSHLNKMNGDRQGQAREEGGLGNVEQERSNKARLVGTADPFGAALCQQQKMSAQLIGLVCQ